MSATVPDRDPPSGPRAEATRSAVIETAERLFRTIGYQKTTVADIARELRMSPANVYRFFASKAAINEAICKRTLDGLDSRAWTIARGPGTPEQRLRTLFTTLQQQTLELFFTEKRLHDMVTAALEEHWPAIEQHVEAIDTAIRHIIMDGQANGSFAKLDPQLTCELVHWAMVGFAHPGLVSQCRVPDNLPKMAAAMADFVIRALRPNPRTDEC